MRVTIASQAPLSSLFESFKDRQTDTYIMITYMYLYIYYVYNNNHIYTCMHTTERYFKKIKNK